MFQILSTLKNRHNSKFLSITQVRYLLYTKQNAFKITSVIDPSLSPASSEVQINEPRSDLSLISFSGIAKSVLLKCSHLLEINKDNKSCASASLKGLLLDLSDVVPETTRKLLRVLGLKPEHVLEILLAFQYECEKVGYERGKVETLWEIFKWACEKNRGFKHLPRSCEVMAWMLMRVGMFREIEYLVLTTDGVLLNRNEIFVILIEGYVSVGDLERAALVFDRMRTQGLVPSLSCYHLLIDYLVKMKRIQLAFQVCLDMMETGFSLSDVEKASIENVARLLCREGKIQESRNLVRKVMAFGLEPSGFVLNEIACGYCEKNDFEDLLSFFVEMKHAPDILTGNKIVYTLCSIFGVDRADFFLQELERLCFKPDERTFGILIGWSCHEGNLRSSFIYLSEILSRGLKPDAHSYSSLISGLFKEGIWKHAKDILNEMLNNGTHPPPSIYRLLLAGYCKARQFDEARVIISEMANLGFIELSSLEDPLSKAFGALGLNPLTVRLRRDNDVGFSKTEFFDNLGNGLYLDTDQNEFDKRLTKILENSMTPDFNALVMVECANGNLKAALLLVDEMERWGQELSLSVFSALVKHLCASRSHMKACIILFEQLPKLGNQLDQETLNLLVQACCKKGLVHNGKVIFCGMLQRSLIIKNETYTALLIGLCKKGILKDLHDFWYIAIKNNWLPELEDGKTLVECLCHRRMLKEALVLLEHMLEFYPYLRSDIYNVFLEKLCVMGFSTAAHALVEELIQRGCNLGQMAYSHVIKGLCEEKKFSVAFRMLDSMLAKNMAPWWDACLLLIPHLLRADRFDKAIKLQEICLKEQSVVLFSFERALVKGFCMTGEVEEASTVFQDMLSKGLLPEAEVCNMLIEGHCQANNSNKVRELLTVMIKMKLRLSISCYRNCVRWMCMEGRVSWVFSLKEVMLGQGNFDNLVIYNILVFYLLSSGNSFNVNKVLNELVENGLLPDEVTYNFLVYGFSKCKDVSGSGHYLSIMISKGLKPNIRSLRTVTRCLCDAGELEKALNLSQEMILNGWVHDSIIQNSIVDGLLSCGKLQEAEHFLHSIVDKGLLPDSVDYNSLIKRFCGYGRLNKAVELLNIMLKKGSVPNSASYDSVIQGFCTRTKLNQAQNFHAEMLARDLKPSTNTWNTLVRRLCQEGHTAEAEELLICMVNLGKTPTREMYSCVANRYCLENNLKKASELMQAMQRSGHNPDFSSHWSLISNLNNSSDKAGNNDNSQGFLSRLLSGSGFSWGKGSKTKN